MSHVIGTVQFVTPSLVIGPDSGNPASGPDTWTVNFMHTPAPMGSKFVILHFSNAHLPANNRLEVDLGYDTEIFTAADGTDFWTRPVNLYALPEGLVPIRYVTNGASSGGVTLAKYGRGERHPGEQDPTALSNSDPFQQNAAYIEPKYDPFWFCHTPPNWENLECVPVTDFRLPLARSIGMIVMVDKSEHDATVEIVSSCSVTLIDADLVLTAGHCFEATGEDARTASVIFNYETDCGGSRPAGYSGRFVKVQKQVAWRYDSGFDYCLHQLKTPPGLLPIPPRHDLPTVGETIFGIHHPNGAVKKLSPPHSGSASVHSSSSMALGVSLDVSGGSSGSGLFDSAGRVTGVLSYGTACSLIYFPTATIFADIASPPGSPPVTRDVMIVFDRSGSMSLPAGTGRTKIEEARDAASLFVQLVQAGTGNRVGLVSFSTTASSPVDFNIAPVSIASKQSLVGPAPYATGVVGGLTPGGNTTIGGGLAAAVARFPVSTGNPRTILLLTDGLQNTPPMIADEQVALNGIAIEAIGFGTESSLDGALLTTLAETHGGLYHRAGDPLALRKFFALAFGNIFESGTLMDPNNTLAAGQVVSDPISFSVCGEERITVVLGWDIPEAGLQLRIRTPGGATIEAGAVGVEASSGRTWTFLRIPLPYGGERDGGWKVEVFRNEIRIGIAAAAENLPAVTYFVSVIANGGPRLTRYRPSGPLYTGDTVNPLVTLRYPSGGFPEQALVYVTVTRPNGSIGNLLSMAKLRAATTVDADTIPPIQSTLLALEQSAVRPLFPYTETTFELFDDPAHNHGSFEASGVYGNPLANLLTMEGNYTFHVKAVYGTGCMSTRELVWTQHVAVKINPAQTTATTTVTGTNPDGSTAWTITITPRDSYGNKLGPGHSDGFTVTDGPGTIVTGPIQDNGDGSYTVPVSLHPAEGQPTVIIAQPGLPPIAVTELLTARKSFGTRLSGLWLSLFDTDCCFCGCFAIVILVMVIVALLRS